MTTRQLQSLVTGILILAVLLPIALSIWLARNQANNEFHRELQNYTIRAQDRIEMVLEQSHEALHRLNALRMTPCSPEHLLALRRLSYTHRYVQEVIWMDGLTPRCSSLEINSNQSAFPQPDAISTDGYSAWYTSHNDLGMHYDMVAIGMKNYVVVIDPLSFIDVVPFSNNPINLALVGTAKNRIIVSTSPLDIGVWKRASEKELTSLTMNGNRYELLPVHGSQLMIIAWTSLAPQDRAWNRQLAIWMPFGVVISLLAAAFILRILRRLQSPRYRLVDAINSHALVIHYQPVVELRSGKVAGAEALVRWPQPDGTLLSPDVFVPLAEQTGLISQLTRSVMENVFAEMGPWLHQHPQLHIALNLAADDLTSTDMFDRLNQLCAHHGLSPAQIAVELTERSFARLDITGPILARYRQAGYQVCIDDFGTGYSSLSYLQELDVDILKIDKSFVDALGRKQVTSHIIDIAHTLKLGMVAEGVETQAQESWLHQHGVQYGQGWLYSKALPGPEFISWVENNLAQNEDESLLSR